MQSIFELPLIKRIYPSFRKFLAKVFWFNGFKILKRDKLYFLLNYTNYVDRQIAFYGGYEIQQLAVLRDALTGFKPAYCMDIGANIGYYTVQLARFCPKAKIYAYEPDVRNLPQLQMNIRLNDLEDVINVCPKAVSNVSGKIFFEPFAKNSTGKSKVVASSGSRTVSVDAIKLDDEMTLKGQKIFIKIDIEGHELEALMGMKKLLSANQVFLQVESFNENAKKVRKYLEGLSFSYLQSIESDHYFQNFESKY